MADDDVQWMSSCTAVADVGIERDMDGVLKGGVPFVECGVDDMVAYVGVIYDEGGGWFELSLLDAFVCICFEDVGHELRIEGDWPTWLSEKIFCWKVG